MTNSTIWIYTFLSVIVVSLLSLIGVITLSLSKKLLNKILLLLVSLSAGVMLGDSFLHLIPQSSKTGLSINTSLLILSGIVVFFILEKIVCWRHCHAQHPKTHIHPYAIMNLIGDSIHNFIDGFVIAGSYMVSTTLGIATTIAVILHEIPQEIGDFGVLIHGGFKKSKAILFNFMTALTAILGAMIALLLSTTINTLPQFIIPFTAGGFIYIASSDLIPQIHHHHKKGVSIKHSLLELFFFVLGIALMYGLLFIE